MLLKSTQFTVERVDYVIEDAKGVWEVSTFFPLWILVTTGIQFNWHDLRSPQHWDIAVPVLSFLHMLLQEEWWSLLSLLLVKRWCVLQPHVDLHKTHSNEFHTVREHYTSFSFGEKESTGIASVPQLSRYPILRYQNGYQERKTQISASLIVQTEWT